MTISPSPTSSSKPPIVVIGAGPDRAGRSSQCEPNAG